MNKSPLQRRRAASPSDFEIVEIAQPSTSAAVIDDRYTKHNKATFARTLRVALILALTGIATLLLIIFLSTPVAQTQRHVHYVHNTSQLPLHIKLDTDCPLQYARLSMSDINSGSKPYILGGRQQPTCRNCEVDSLWGHFCQFQSHGPVCDNWLQWALLDYYVNRTFVDYLTLSPCDFWPFLQNRTTFLIGDSQMLDTYKALKCFLFEFWDVTKDEDPLLSTDPTLLAKLTHNKVPPSCVLLPGNSRLCFIRVDKVGQLVNVVLPNYNQFGTRHDLVVLNFGLWLKDPSDYGWELEFLEAFHWVFKRCLPFIIWKDTPMQHFDTIYGEYPGKKHADEPFVCAPIANVTLHPNHTLSTNSSISHIVLEGGWRNKMAKYIMSRMGVPVVHTWNETLDMWRFHKANAKGLMECTHYCHPSAPQVWVWSLYQTLLSSVDQINRFLSTEPAVSDEPECALLHTEGLKGEGDHMFLIDLVPAFYKSFKRVDWQSIDLPFMPQDDGVANN